jgi:hypothetical protein
MQKKLRLKCKNGNFILYKYQIDIVKDRRVKPILLEMARIYDIKEFIKRKKCCNFGKYVLIYEL